MRHSGGAERYVSELRSALRAAGDDVRLLTSSAGSAGDGTADYVAWGTEARAAQSVLQLVNPRAFRSARRAVRDFRPEAVLVLMFANHLSPSIFAAFRGLPTAYLATDFKVVCPTFAKRLPSGATCTFAAGRACLRAGCLNAPHWVREQARYALIRRAVLGAPQVLACSEAVRRELARNGIESIHLPLPVAPPDPSFRRAPAPDPVFVLLGRLAEQKGIFSLLRAFARLHAELPGARLRFVGDGPDREALARAIAERALDGAVELVGWKSPERLEEWLRDAWALVAPTLGPEPLGMVAIEAILRDLPVVATANGGFLESVEPGRTGLLVRDGDEEALLGALRAVATGAVFAEHRVDAAAAARLRARHDPEGHVDALRALFRAGRGACASPRGSSG
jgi:glycosyltransferase involved in cell wall biosynthesis